MNKNFSKNIINLFKSWENHDVNYCHWKSTNHLEASYLVLTDLDVLIDRSDTYRAISLALNQGFVELKSSHFRGYPAVRDFIKYDKEKEKWIHLHFHTQLSSGDRWVKAYHLPFEKYILRDRIFDKDYNSWTISPSYELLILIYRMNAKFRKNWLKDKKIIEEVVFIQKRIKKYNYYLDDKIEGYIGLSGVNLLKDLANGKDLSKIKEREIRKAFSKNQFRRITFTRFFCFSKLRYLYRIYTEFNRRIRKDYSSGRRTLPNGGMIITFVGIDGSGKSSGIERIRHFFGKHMNVQTNFLGSGKSGAGFMRRMIMNVVGFKAKSKGHKEARKIGKQKMKDVTKIKKPPIFYILWTWLVTKDRERQLKQIQRGLGNGNLILVDRWLQDGRLDAADAPRLINYVSFNGFLGMVARREKKLFDKIKLIPLHQVLKLNITPEISVKRKPGELTIEKAEESIRKLNLLEWPEETNVVNIDGKQCIADVTNKIKQAIFDCLQKETNCFEK